MGVNPFICAAIAAALLPAAALADDPRDAPMRSAAVRAQDSDATRRLNLRESAMVRQRDAHREDGAAAGAGGRYLVSSDDYPAAVQAYDRAMEDYRRGQEQHARDMAAWRRAVAACQSGDDAACDTGR